MSAQITTAFVEQFKNNVYLLAQQKGSRLRSCVRNEDITGETAYFEQIGAVEAEDITTRHGDSPLMETPHARRKVTPIDSDWGDLIDKLDKVKMLIDPTSPYALSAAYALGRRTDDHIITAATGTAYTGKAGTTSTVLPSTQKVAVNLGGSNIGLTIAKLIAAKSLFGQNDVDIDDPINHLYFAVSQQQLDDLLNTTEVTSADYNTVRALVKGEVDTFMGFEFKRTERLALNSSTDVRTCFAWARSGICLGVNADMQTEIAKRSDKRFSTYVYACMSQGATRMEEEKVVQVLCDESP